MSDLIHRNFLVVGQRVEALKDIWDFPGNDGQGPFHAAAGDIGICVHVEPDFFPTVKFDKTGTLTDVTPDEVKAI